MQPQVTAIKFISIQVCVPPEWTDDQIIAFAERQQPCGTTAGWSVAKATDERPYWQERVICGDPERGAAGFVHVVLHA